MKAISSTTDAHKYYFIPYDCGGKTHLQEDFNMANILSTAVAKTTTICSVPPAHSTLMNAPRVCATFIFVMSHKDAKGNLQRYYRLHATVRTPLKWRALRDQLPECSNGRLKQVGRCLNSHELGHICPVCENARAVIKECRMNYAENRIHTGQPE